MTLLRATPKDHGLLLDHDPRGNRRLSVTLAGKSPGHNGRRLQYATGPLYQRSFQHISAILWQRQSQRLAPPETVSRQYHPITEETAIQIRLLLAAVAAIPQPGPAERLARAIAAMHPCESGWWYACHQNRRRPRKVIQALQLLYA